jgi:hypothetical protein
MSISEKKLFSLTVFKIQQCKMEIKHLTHHKINLQKWDACIKNACNSLVYAESWYLDVVSPNWEALVMGDYEYVMPLPVKEKYGLFFLVQPRLTQQLGVFSAHQIEEHIMERFIQKIPYRSYHLNLNEHNKCRQGVKLPNYMLDLSKDYDSISSAYSTNTKRNIKKACSYENIIIEKNVWPTRFWELIHDKEKGDDIFVNKLTTIAYEREKLVIYGAVNEDEVLVSALCLLYSPQRIIYLLPVSNKEGKKTLAMFRIVDAIIKDYANSNLILDFEGSKIDGIARFYQGFGAKLHHYYEIKRWSINDFIKRFCFWK